METNNNSIQIIIIIKFRLIIKVPKNPKINKKKEII